MEDSSVKALAQLNTLADKIALELAYTQAGSDAGLLPINSLIADMMDAADAANLPAATDALQRGRDIIESVFLSDGQFTAQSIGELNLWLPWVQAVFMAIEQGKPLPKCPVVNPGAPAGAKSCNNKSQNPDVGDAPLILDLGDRELLTEFVQESREHLENIEAGVLALEENPNDATVNSIFRSFHTFKGGSGFLNLAPINKLAHELESLLDLARNHKIQITTAVIEVILKGGDTLKQFIDAIDAQISGHAPEGPILIPTAALRQRVALVIAEPIKLAPETFESPTSFIQRAVETVGENLPIKNASGATAHFAAPTIKIDTSKLDMLIDMVGEMVIAQSLVAQDAAGLASPRLTRNLGQLARATKELQRTAMSLRMVPIRGTFQKMNRLVRDLCVRAEKQVHLEIDGEEAELDRNIVDAISDPLIHMIRNAVDHGIEKPSARKAAGKDPTGRITLKALHRGGNFVIEMSDDGAGLNCHRIRQKAIQRGLIARNATLTDKEIHGLIFAAGFSTAETVTDLSGRGVGMDVVRGNIEKLRGKVEIESKEGQGTTFIISLPLTLAIIDGLIVRVGTDRYIIPTLSVRESFRPARSMLSRVQNKGEVVAVRGRLLPLVRLSEFLNCASDHSDPTEGTIVVIETDGIERCLLVDELIGKQEVVIKTLGDTFQENPLLAGAAILGDGRVGLILDCNALTHSRTNHTLSKAA